ncbi:MAG: hypothetical protein P8J27_05115 [Mariniblastus sp.]|nr:hypothetical protein [Mariniblastus sp.]
MDMYIYGMLGLAVGMGINATFQIAAIRRTLSEISRRLEQSEQK